MESFDAMGLHEALNFSLEALGFQTPTPIQAQTIPHAIEGKDILGSAQTGTGKTIAYGIPLITYLLNNEHATSIVLVPTRELAIQVMQQLHQLVGKKSSINSALLIGGDSMFKQLSKLKSRPRMIVGTPGRVNDHLDRGTLKLHKAEFLVFDETDRMLDMGFTVQIQKIVQQMPKQRQTLMFSATMSPDIIKTAQNYMQDAIRISVGSTTTPTEKIKQEIIKTEEHLKYNLLMDYLNKVEGSFIIFMKTKHATERLATKLRTSGHTANAIHGDLRQRNREEVIKSFREGKHRILVATDVAARGLDISHIECVVNYDLPTNAEDYIHRIGRTGRAGKEGMAISFVTEPERTKWKIIDKLINKGEHTAPVSHSRSNDRSDRNGFADGAKKKYNGGGARNGNGSNNGASSGRPAGQFDRNKRQDGGGNKFNNGANSYSAGNKNRKGPKAAGAA